MRQKTQQRAINKKIKITELFLRITKNYMENKLKKRIQFIIE
jgi:hypothetical protein